MRRVMKLVAYCGELEGIQVSQRRTADWSVGATVNLYNGVGLKNTLNILGTSESIGDTSN
jgi:hypothetical protein